MEISEIKNRINKIKEAASKEDDEEAHILLDHLYIDFIQDIKEGCFNSLEDVVNCAKLVYSAENIDFFKWYA